MRKTTQLHIASAAACAAALATVHAFGQTTQPIAYNDILLATSKSSAAQTTQHVRGNPATLNNGTLVGSTWDATFIQSMEFDHTDGLRHNYTGNALGLDFGTLATGGGVLYNMQTKRTPNDTVPGPSQRIFNIRDYNTSTGNFIFESRLGSIVVSPLNNRIAVTGNDSGEVYVADYSNGATPGTGAGASVSNVKEGLNLTAGGSQTHGAVFFDNDNVLSLEHGNGGVVHKTNVSGPAFADATVANLGLPTGRNYFSSMLYEPTLSPNVYVMVSDFTSSVTTNRLIVLDPTNNYAQVGSFNYSTSINTSREIAFDVNGNLLIGEFSQPIGSPVIDVVPHGNILANLGNNNSQDYYSLVGGVGTASFVGLDAASALIDYKTAGLTNNIRNKALVVRYFPGQVADPEATIRQRLITGRNGGAWNGTGSAIISTDAQTTPNTAIGYAQASELGLVGGTFGGVSVDGPAVLVKYTWAGDANLDGRVTFDDYVKIDTGFNTGLTGWVNGDFNYSGSVTFDDYVLIDISFNQQNGTRGRAVGWISGDDRSAAGLDSPGMSEVLAHLDQFGSEYASAFLAAVPEPTSLALVGTPALALAVRRRRRRATVGCH